MGKLLLLITMGIAVLSCNTTDYTNCGCDKSRVKSNSTMDSTIRYSVNYDSLLLSNFHKAPIFQNNTETYRLSSIPFGTEYTQLITLQRTSSGAKLSAEQYRTTQGFKWRPNLESQFIRDLNEAEWLYFRGLIFKKCFWASQKKNEGKDGHFSSSWLIEGFDPKRNNCTKSEYHVDFATLNDTADIGDIVRKMLSYIDKSNFKKLESITSIIPDSTRNDPFNFN